METKSAKHPPAASSCHHTRLAESAVAAVDICECGMMQIHIGALTLRMTPGAVSELLGTLGHAVAERAARGAVVGPAAGTRVALLARERGQA
ncbi:MAG: hypothetical protein OXT09_13780 [Myxococcales bacterium]|nr:hypothetical protein [Myxococcales bacterium]